MQCRAVAGQFRGLGLKSSSWYLVFSCRGRLFLLSRHRESKNKRHPTCLFILWNICGKQENDKHPCSKSNIFDLWNFRNIIYTFDCAELSIQQNPNLWLRTQRKTFEWLHKATLLHIWISVMSRVLSRYWVDTEYGRLETSSGTIFSPWADHRHRRPASGSQSCRWWGFSSRCSHASSLLNPAQR